MHDNMHSMVKGIVTVEGERYNLDGDGGLALIRHHGKLVMIRYSCPLETWPPQGAGHVVLTETADIVLIDGELWYGGVKLHQEVTGWREYD
jgi:hypothetical protein